jgi:long-chain acyl-CoA synthetase
MRVGGEASRSSSEKRHSRVLAIGNRALDLGTLLGLWRAGAVAVPVHREAAPLTRGAIEQATRARFRVDGLALDRIAEAPPPERPLLEGAALVVFTSGSTAAPKGVVLGHQALARKLAILDRLLGLRPDDVVVVPLQLTFIFGIWASLLAIRSGAALVLVQKFTPATLAGLLAADATVLAAVPTMLRALLADGAPPAPRLRAVLTGGEALSPSLAGTICGQWSEAELVDLYGSTETGSCLRLLPPASGWRGGRVDRRADRGGFVRHRLGRRRARLSGPDRRAADPNRLRHARQSRQRRADPLRPRGGPLPDGRSRAPMPGRSGRARRALEEDHRAGRQQDRALEIENALCAHPDIAAVLCAGVPDARLGEAIHAVVVLKPGLELSADELRPWASARLERYKVPDEIVFSDTLPSGATGKRSRAMVNTLTLVRAETASAALDRAPVGS